MRWFKLGLVVAIVTSATSLSAQQPSRAEQEVLQVQAERFKAVIGQDLKTLELMVADDLSYCHASAQVEDKASYLNTVRTGRIKWVTMVPEGSKTHVYGDTAVITGTLRQTILSGGRTEPTPLVVRSLEIYVRRAGRWQFVAYQATRVTEQKPAP